MAVGTSAIKNSNGEGGAAWRPSCRSAHVRLLSLRAAPATLLAGVATLGGLAAVPAPALDSALDDAGFVAGLAPEASEARVRRSRALLGLEVVEADADRDGDAFAADDALAIAERR